MSVPHINNYTEIRQIPGLIRLSYEIYPDARGVYGVNYNSFEELELDEAIRFDNLQTNVSVSYPGTIRGIHAEPWGKETEVVWGTVLAALVELRDGDNFGYVYTVRLEPGQGLIVPIGVGHSFQSLGEPDDSPAFYVYSVDGQWRPNTNYPALNPLDPALAIPWADLGIPPKIKEADLNHPTLAQADRKWFFETWRAAEAARRPQ